ncbi:MAG: arginine--tRNA ligase [Opitutales bacterium]|nr:arginine--tRNA ligase [Opitutales bacterium]
MKIKFNTITFLEDILNEVAEKIGLSLEIFKPDVRVSDPRFGDLQANGILTAAKRSRCNPRELAEKFVEELNRINEGQFEKIGISGPGFLNFKLSKLYHKEYFDHYCNNSFFDNYKNLNYFNKNIIIDYPSPNTAKQMHVGHLRILVIGEAISRLLEFCGSKVIRDNHIGDWGTNFGVLIFEIKRVNYQFNKDDSKTLEELESLYKSGMSYCKDEENHPGALDEARLELVKLQQGDPENMELWKHIVRVSNSACEKIYELFGVHPDVTLGESFYRDKVNRVYDELISLRIAEEDAGALVVWQKAEDKEKGNIAPFIIRKKDGGSNYGSTDLATVLYRSEHFNADEVIYVTDDRQKEHFKMLFSTVDRWFSQKKYPLPKLCHVTFGKILGEDGKPIKTKSGESIKLKALVNEATERALTIVKEKNTDLDMEEMEKISTIVGISSIKYADLLQNRTLDYMFSWKRLLAFEGNTAPYLLYAVVRINSVFKKMELSLDDYLNKNIGFANFTEPEEIEIVKKLEVFENVINLSVSELKLHYICTYIYELAGLFSVFYSKCKINVEDGNIRDFRLKLCATTAMVLKRCLKILSIDTLEKM